MTTSTRPQHDAIIIGAGFSGIGSGIKLDEIGLSNYVILEAGDGIGGAWHFNTYPGVAVDIPSLSYSFSFERNPNWSRVFAPGAELKAYAEHCVDKYRLRSRIQLNTAVRAIHYDESAQIWQVHLTDGRSLTARYVIGATGVFTQPKLPDIDGIQDFAGTIMHTARWDHDVSLRGKRVGIIGTGASALQIIPEIAPEVGHLTVFQRTPIWVMPKPDAAIPNTLKRLMSKAPLLQLPARAVSQAFVETTFVLAAHYDRPLHIVKYYEKVGKAYLERAVKDPVTRAKLTPQYGMGCKRPSVSNSYLQTFNRSNVSLVTEGIERVTTQGVQTRDGQLHELDILICATGFKVFENGNMPPYEVIGREGRNLEQWWDANRYQAYEGVSIPHMPNFFMILGPNGYNGASYFQLIEHQLRHIGRCLSEAKAREAQSVEITESANKRYFDEMKSRMGRQVFYNNTCGNANSYYFDKHGDVPFRPATSIEAHWRSMTFPMTDYQFR